MLLRDDIERLLALQSQAYALLLWVAESATRDADLLLPHAAVTLHKPDQAELWVEYYRPRIPADLLPAEVGGAFANLLASFFSTSFRVSHFEWDGELVESRLKLGANPTPESKSKSSFSNLEHCEVLALRHLASSEKILLSEKDARRLARRKSLREPSLLWTYVWELDRRARNKGKGAIVHQLWRSLPRETRGYLDVEQVWLARTALLSAARELHDQPQGQA